jgi:Putative Flp pilus-assembly TadE/G-like
MRLSKFARNRKGERGVTIILVAIAMITLLAMAALAIDVVTLYVARTEAQRVAESAALAGAKMFVSSGYTSGQLGAIGGSGGAVCGGATGPANVQATQTANQNMIGGQPPTTVNVTCDFTVPENPKLTVQVQRTGLPTFFSKIWGGGAANSVSATATAEAFNSSGSAGSANVPIQVASVKPFLLPNCSPAALPPPGGPCAVPYFVDATYVATGNEAAYIGTSLTLSPGNSLVPPPPFPMLPYYVADMPTQATTCPSTAGSCLNAGGGGIYDNIACANPAPLACGTGLQLMIDQNTGSVPVNTEVSGATQCLTHAAGVGMNQGQDTFTASGIGAPVAISPGTNNPNPIFAGQAGTINISRSDSVITVPIFTWAGNPCTSGPGTPCTGATATVNIVGFLQLGVLSVDAAGNISAYILNVASCNPGAGANPVSGGGVAPVPARLIHP